MLETQCCALFSSKRACLLRYDFLCTEQVSTLGGHVMFFSEQINGNKNAAATLNNNYFVIL